MLVSDREITYLPFERSTVTVNDEEYGELQGLSYNINTLRLMEDTDCRLILEKKETGETLFNISLPDFLGNVGTLYRHCSDRHCESRGCRSRLHADGRRGRGNIGLDA